MKKILLLGIAVCMLAAVNAQRVYFVYLQSEGGNPFYVKMGDKILSSSSDGYLILPKLIDSTYKITIGQSGIQREGVFSIAVNKSDKGFLIKKQDGGLVLFDLQSLSIYKPASTEVLTAFESSEKKTDKFSTLLAQAADDTTLLLQPVLVKRERESSKTTKVDQAVAPVVAVAVTPKETAAVPEKAVVKNDVLPEENSQVVTQTVEIVDTVKQIIAEVPAKETTVDTLAAATLIGNKEIIVDTIRAINLQEPPLQPVEEFRRSVISKYSESSTTEGFGLVYLDNQAGVIDTIRIVIPNPKFTFITQVATVDTAKGTQFLEINNKQAEGEKPAKAASSEPLMKSAGCTALANEKDFLKLRKNMAAKEDDDEMIAEARKVFKSKCFSTEQVKNLSALFLTGAGKYQFFDAVYQYVSDKGNFSSLESEIKDEYNLNRFKALLGN